LVENISHKKLGIFFLFLLKLKFNGAIHYKYCDRFTVKNATETRIRKAKKLLFLTLNCCESQIIPIQALSQEEKGIGKDGEARERRDAQLRTAVMGLAGGINNNGSTCGVVFGGALNLGMLHRAESQTWDITNEIQLLLDVQAYVKKFEQKFGSSLCRERTGLNLKKFTGKIGLLNPNKVRGCVNQTAWAMNYVSESPMVASVPSPDAAKKSTDSTSGTEATDIPDARDTTTDTKEALVTSIDHCSTAIFDEVRKRTGIGDAYLRQLSTGLSGGIGLSGGGCAALSAAIMLLGLKFGNEKINYDKGEKRSPLRLAPPKFMKTANKLLKVFKKKFGSLECREITATKFDSIASFNEYRSQGHCIEIKEFVNEFMVKALLPKKKT